MTEDVLKEIVARHTRSTWSSIDSHFNFDALRDSGLALAEIIVEVEDLENIRIPDDDYDQLVTYGDIVTLLVKIEVISRSSTKAV